MACPAITVENLSKAYRIGLKEEVPDTLTQAALGWARAPWRNFQRLRRLNTFNATVKQARGGRAENEIPDAEHPVEDDIIWALKDVSFDVHEGEVVGIIGRNGAGKSTLLKILSRITEPTSGRAVIRGRVSSLLEVGTGFHPELTGRENIYMNGTILGMTKREIDRKFDEIVDFSGVENFLDTPVKRYSSGMKVRLAFAVAAHLEPEILIIDEVLAVGDVGFQKKCLGKMQDVASEGRTVLFVSHNMPAVRTLTSRGVFLKFGQLAFEGHTSDAIECYLKDNVAKVSGGCGNLDYFRRERREDSSPIHVERIWLAGHEPVNGSFPRVESGNSVTICCEIESSISLEHACLSVGLLRDHDQRVATFFSDDSQFALRLEPGRHVVQLHIDNLPLAPGTYTVDIGVNKNANAKAFDVVLDYPLCEVGIQRLETGELDWPHRPWGAVDWRSATWQLA